MPSGAATVDAITHAITLKGGELWWAKTERIDKRKRIENRSFAMSGWYAVHIGKKDIRDDLMEIMMTDGGQFPPKREKWPKGCVVGAIHISGTCSPAGCKGTSQEQWALGPVCNWIDDVICCAPIAGVRGALDSWPLVVRGHADGG